MLPNVQLKKKTKQKTLDTVSMMAFNYALIKLNVLKAILCVLIYIKIAKLSKNNKITLNCIFICLYCQMPNGKNG